jgi:hypothetical protein
MGAPCLILVAGGLPQYRAAGSRPPRIVAREP